MKTKKNSLSASVLLLIILLSLGVYSIRETFVFQTEIERIHVERLMTSVITFVMVVDWLRCEANYQTLLGGG